jgi:uncharacterized protein (TIGR02996 family)
LLDLIVADPDDLATRRIYADQLLARGDARGAFIQAQCGGATEVADELLKKHFKQWVLPIPPDNADVTFVNGFIEQWRCDAPMFIRLGARVARRTPLRRAVISEVSERQLTALLTSTAFRELREIELRGLREWCFYELAAAQFPRLRRLVLEGGPRGRQHAFAGLLHQQWFSTVRELGVELPMLDADLLPLAEILPRLEELSVQARIPDGPAPLLLRLRIGYLRSDSSRVQRLLREDALQLNDLLLANCFVSDELVAAILAAPALRTVGLESCALLPKHREALFERFTP